MNNDSFYFTIIYPKITSIKWGLFFYLLALLSFVVDFRNFCLLIRTEGGDSCGISVQADTPQKLCFEEDWRMPHGKRPPAVEINNNI